ncbi:MAG: hypothetical protein A2591_03970 [Candidatus Yonathbacteria bacterium RIFOXYD1_FULL_52_36]|uniref:Uncharacterized protein n=1 Tax=Candidatus Yonathbacteria bacterium RIFOXYD1_FULL_52_36 TaxID=1802730 RepID=A0A1G2SJQ8_9BACT|nr:MAG: hypothetical protein A2591_03970 [Candidatus Yonathbacteria bacterium RIFOXYD1_FULL_52_36]
MTTKTESKSCILEIADGPAINPMQSSLTFSPMGDRPSVHFTVKWGDKTFYFRLIIISLKRLDDERYTFEAVFPSRVNSHHPLGGFDVQSNNYDLKRRKGFMEIPAWVTEKLNQGEYELR